MSMCMCLEQRVEFTLHSPISNPQLTEDAINENEDSLFHSSTLALERDLLSRWDFSESWQSYLDSPLLAHADAALALRKYYDTVVAIRSAGIPYGKIFEMAGFSYYEIDYSHHKRNMRKPEMNILDLFLLQDKQSVLLIDIDVVSGKTLRAVYNFLKNQDVNVQGAYIGLSQWPGVDKGVPYIGNDKVDFGDLWANKIKSFRIMRNSDSYTKNHFPEMSQIIPSNLPVFGVNPNLDSDLNLALKATTRVQEYFQNKNIVEKLQPDLIPRVFGVQSHAY